MDINKFQRKHLKTVARNTPVFVTLVDKSKYRNLICTLFMLRRVTNMHSAEYGIAFLFNVYTLFINITFLRFHRFCLDVFLHLSPVIPLTVTQSVRIKFVTLVGRLLQKPGTIAGGGRAVAVTSRGDV